MTNYTNVKVRISEGQKDKLKKAFESNCKSVTIRLAFSDLQGEDVIAITNSQLDRLAEAYEEKKGMTIKMSKTQLAYNMKLEGGFLPISHFCPVADCSPARYHRRRRHPEWERPSTSPSRFSGARWRKSGRPLQRASASPLRLETARPL